MKNSINWFEIPVVDMKRATSFYAQLLALDLETTSFNGAPMTVLKADGVSGALMPAGDRKPSADGALIYLNVDGQLDTVIARIEKAGGKLLTPRVDIGKMGAFAVLRDTEGNHVGLHQS